ncbi:MAG TPA: hypothetical protein VEK07_19090 [Polyangiaceae bacterium]|nr:hypothetical protein [Polyangiaceae bacterium]
MFSSMGSRSCSDNPPRSPWLRRAVRAAAAAAIGASLALACSTSTTSQPGAGGSNSNNGSNSTSGGSFSTTTLSDGAVVTTETFADGATMVVSSSSSSGGGGGGAATDSAAGGGGSTDGGDGGIVCSNTNKSILSIDPTGFIYNQCDVYGIQGAWYCFSNDTSSGGCTMGVPPYSATDSHGPGMCQSGTLEASTSAYVGLGLSLNATPGANAVKSAYDAAASGVIGFAITVTGTTGGDDLRIGFTNTAATMNAAGMGYVAPFATEPAPSASGTTYTVLFSSVKNVPDYPNIADPDAALDPTGIYDVQVELAGAAAQTYAYDFCITSIQPLFAGDASTQAPGSCSMMDTVGGQTCDPQDIVDGVDYGFQNNISQGSGECIQATQGGDCAGLTITFPNGSFGSGGNTPSSYPSIIYGWQNGQFYGSYTTGQTLSSISMVPATWSYSVPGGTYDAAWDIWFGSTPSGTSPTLELMVWNGYNGVQPAGSQVQGSNGMPKTVTISGATYQVWTGQVNTWKYIAYRNTSPSASGAVSVNLNDFFEDAETENVGLSTSSYLWGIQAGYEIYSASGTFTTSSYSVTVN